MTRALHRASTARATAISDDAQVLFAFGGGLALFDEVPTIFSVAGALAIAAGVIAASRAQRSPARA